jgi:hypothetical protein
LDTSLYAYVEGRGWLSCFLQQSQDTFKAKAAAVVQEAATLCSLAAFFFSHACDYFTDLNEQHTFT